MDIASHPDWDSVTSISITHQQWKSVQTSTKDSYSA